MSTLVIRSINTTIPVVMVYRNDEFCFGVSFLYHMQTLLPNYLTFCLVELFLHSGTIMYIGKLTLFTFLLF
jgi:hypothetical protein